MVVNEIIKTKGSAEVFTLPHNVTVRKLIEEMSTRNIGALLVTSDAGALAGIVSERDIVRHLHRKTDFDRTPIGEIMTRNLITVAPQDDVHRAMDLMIQHKIRHLPVQSKDGIHGLITVRDILYSLRKADELELQNFVAYLQESVNKHGME